MPDVDATDDASLDDLFGAIGITNAPITREDLFANENLTQNKIDLLRFWLRHEIATFHSMVDKGIVPCKIQISTVTKVGSYRPVSVLDYGTACIDRYLCIYHLPWFMDLPGRPALDRPAMVQRILAMPNVKEVIEKAP